MKADRLRVLIREELRKILTEAKPGIVTREYMASHGKAPKGNGNWAFRLEKTDRGKDGDLFWPSQGGKGAMPLQKALQLAKVEAQETGMNYIIIMP